MEKNKLKNTIIGLGCSFVNGAEVPPGKSFINLLGGINLGENGSGNFGAVSRLLMTDIPNNSTIIFMPTGMNRMDFFNKDWKLGDLMTHAFPNAQPINLFGQKLMDLEKALSYFVSERTEVYNAIINILNIQNYCKANGHCLVVFPAFNREYNREYFYKTINDNFVDCVEWDRFLTIDGCSNFFDWVIKQAGSSVTLSMMEMHRISEKFPELNDWITPRFHPSEKAHKLFAEKICEFL